MASLRPTKPLRGDAVMSWIRIAACAAAALFASYASAQPLEGAPVGAFGKPVTASSGPTIPSARKAPHARIGAPAPASKFRKALEGAQSQPASATRGAAEAELYRKAAPSVVLIVTDKGLGSGALISADGQIVTNHHVVRGAKQIGVVFKPAIEGARPGPTDVKRGELVKVDEVADLALIKVDAIPPGVGPLKLGDSGALQVGADVNAIGHPTGETWTYTRGVVSQIRRAYEWQAGDPIHHEATVIQTQTPINPGNSGGPLLNVAGEIVGLNSFSGEGEGLNYAVSSEDVKTFLARSHDRRPVQNAAQESDKCEWKTVRSESSAKPKGVLDYVDTDCDGEVDSQIFTPANKRDPGVFMTSEDEESHGQIDTLYFDQGRDGTVDWVLYDTDHNGKPDLRGDFRNGEDEPYRWEKIPE